MFILSRLFDTLFLPPGIIIVMIITALFFYFFKRNRVFWVLLLTSLGLLYLFSIVPVQDFLLRPLENRFPPLSIETEPDVEYVVILGGGTIIDSPDEYGKSSPSGGALKRLIYGMRTANSLGLPVILSGGTTYPEDMNVETEAESAARILLDLGFRADSVFIEKTSKNTWENSIKVKEMFNPGAVILVTSAFHMPRSVLSFKKHGILTVPAPTDYRIIRRPYDFWSYLPSVRALEGAHIALKEYVGLLFYLIRR